MWYLLGHLAEGGTGDEFLANFPTAGREQAVKTLKMASLLLEAMVYENALTGPSHSEP